MRHLLTLIHLPLALVIAAMMLAAGCASGTTDTAGDGTTVPPTAVSTTTIPTTTTAPTTTSSTPTTTQPTAPTTVALTTTTDACPDVPMVSFAYSNWRKEVEPGTYQVPLLSANFTFTVAEPTRLYPMETMDEFGFEPIPETEWQHPDRLFEDLLLRGLPTGFVSYDGESEIEVDDFASWMTEHPLLETTEPTMTTVGGYEAVQIDAVVTGTHPAFEDRIRFDGWSSLIPTGAALRLVFFEVDGVPLFFMLVSTEEGFEDGAAWADSIIAGIEFC